MTKLEHVWTTISRSENVQRTNPSLYEQIGTNQEYLQRLVYIYSIHTILPCMVPNILIGTGVLLLV